MHPALASTHCGPEHLLRADGHVRGKLHAHARPARALLCALLRRSGVLCRLCPRREWIAERIPRLRGARGKRKFDSHLNMSSVKVPFPLALNFSDSFSLSLYLLTSLSPPLSLRLCSAPQYSDCEAGNAGPVDGSSPCAPCAAGIACTLSTTPRA